MGCYVLGFREIDQTQVAIVGEKGAQLGELSRIEGIRMPAGFCVTTDAFRRMIPGAPSIDERLDRLSRRNRDDRESIREGVRRLLEDSRQVEVVACVGDTRAARRCAATCATHGSYRYPYAA